MSNRSTPKLYFVDNATLGSIVALHSVLARKIQLHGRETPLRRCIHRYRTLRRTVSWWVSSPLSNFRPTRELFKPSRDSIQATLLMCFSNFTQHSLHPNLQSIMHLRRHLIKIVVYCLVLIPSFLLAYYHSYPSSNFELRKKTIRFIQPSRINSLVH